MGKEITINTILKLNDNLYKAEKHNLGFVWRDKKDNILAATFKLEGIPVISDSSFYWYLDRLAALNIDSRFSLNPNTITTFERLHKETFLEGYKSNPNQYTQKDIEKAIELAIESHVCAYIDEDKQPRISYDLEDTTKEILEQINAITEIEVDEQFNIISYE